MRCLQCDTELDRTHFLGTRRWLQQGDPDRCRQCGSPELVYDATDHPSVTPLNLDDFVGLRQDFDEFDARDFDALGFGDEPAIDPTHRSSSRANMPYDAELEDPQRRIAHVTPSGFDSLLQAFLSRAIAVRPAPRVPEYALGGASLLFLGLSLVALVSAVAMVWQLL